MIHFKRDFVTLNKSVINYLPRCSYHLLYTSNSKFVSSRNINILLTLKPEQTHQDQNVSFHFPQKWMNLQSSKSLLTPSAKNEEDFTKSKTGFHELIIQLNLKNKLFLDLFPQWKYSGDQNTKLVQN